MSIYVDAFVDLVRKHQKPAMSVAEIGCFDGSTSRHAIVPVFEMKGTYTVVDWFKGTVIPNWQTDTNPHVYKPNKNVRKDFERNLTGFESCYKIIESTTEDAALLLDDESLDICFLDSDHAYDAVSRDLDLYLPKVKSGGIICGHDFDDDTPDFKLCKMAMELSDKELSLDTIIHNGKSLHPGVAKAVYERFGQGINRQQNTIYPNYPSIWWKYKE